MAVYLYRCTLCTHLFEEVKSIKEYIAEEGDKKKCPKCGKMMSPSRVIDYPPTIIFHGSGFYSYDSKRR